MESKSKLSFENKLFRLALIASLPPALLLIITLYYFEISRYALALIAIIIFSVIGYCVYSIRERTQFQLRTVSNLMEAMINNDYSMRGRRANQDDVLGELVLLINGLSDALIKQRLETKETQLLLSKVINQIDVAILAINDKNIITLANPAVLRLLGKEMNEIVNRNIYEKGLSSLLVENIRSLVNIPMLDGYKKFYVYSDEFLEDGKKHKLIFITDIQKILREEERKAWQNLLRVLSHEINNSLSPISSISDTLTKRTPNNAQNRELIEGLSVVNKRANSLKTFIKSYQALSKLPEPEKSVIYLKQVLETIAPLFSDCHIKLCGDDHAKIYADTGQVEQLLVNLLKNATEAMQSDKHILIEWHTGQQFIQISIKDNGVGISNNDNIFTPFYTTKEHGSGIGLVLARQIVANHDGELYLQNRKESQGAEAIIRLPKVS